jgi:hypothetical protein
LRAYSKPPSILLVAAVFVKSLSARVWGELSPMKMAAQTFSFRNKHSIGSFFCLVFVYFALNIAAF